MLQVIGAMFWATVWLGAADLAAGAELTDIADISSRKISIDTGAAGKTYYLIERKGAPEPPKDGFGLLIVLPGGHGRGSEFSPFVRRIHKYALDETWVIALGVARKWQPGQQIVWPTKTNPVKGMRYSTEEYVDAVFKDVSERRSIDPKKVILMGWSSAGPACYATSLSDAEHITGYYVLMSVFQPKSLPPLDRAAGKAYYIQHGKQDKTCPVWMARWARNKLRASGAAVEYLEHEGGHGFRGPVYPRIRKALQWLTSDRPAAATQPSPTPTSQPS